MHAFLIKGLERSPIICQIQLDECLFEIQSILQAYGHNAIKWSSDQASIRLLESSEELKFFDDQENVFCKPIIFQKVLEYCSPIATLYSIGMSTVIHTFITGQASLQWFERELEFVFHGENPRFPLEEENANLKLIIERLKGQRKALKRKREEFQVVGDVATATQSAAKLLSMSRNHIIIVPVAKMEEEND